MEDQIKQIVKELTCYDFEDMPDAEITTLEDVKIKKILALFTQSVEEIIGKDEDVVLKNPVVIPHQIDKYDRYGQARNGLRAEQRARLATLIKQ